MFIDSVAEQLRFIINLFVEGVTVRLIILLLFIMTLSSTFAESESKALSMNLGTFFSSKRIFRGALIWDAPIIAVGPSFKLFNTVSVGQGGLSLFKNFSTFHTLSIGVSAFDDNKPNGPIFILENKEEDYKNKRSSTFGTYLKHLFKYKHYFAASLSYEQDLKRHKGVYFDAKITTSAIPFLTLGIIGSLGDKHANTYAYGPEGASGVGHVGLLGSVFLPFLPWGGALIINYTQTQITQKANENADFVRGNGRNSNLSVIGSWKVY